MNANIANFDLAVLLEMKKTHKFCNLEVLTQY